MIVAADTHGCRILIPIEWSDVLSAFYGRVIVDGQWSECEGLDEPTGVVMQDLPAVDRQWVATITVSTGCRMCEHLACARDTVSG